MIVLKPQIPSEIYHNYRVSTKEGMFASLAIGLVNPFFGIFAVAMDAPNVVIGLITAVPSLINFFMMIPAARFADRHPRKLPLVFWGALAARMFYLPMAAIPYLAGMRGEALILLLTLMTIPMVFMNLSWTSLMGNLFPVQHRGQVFGKRNTWCGLVSMLATVAAGFLLDVIPHPFNWTVLFATAFFAGQASTFIVRSHHEEVTAVPPEKKPYLQQLRSMLSDEATGKKYAIFLTASFLMHLGINFSAPLFAIYLARLLELSNSLIAWMTTLMGATTVLFSMFWGSKVTLHGDDLVFAFALVGMVAFPAMFMLSTSPIYMLLLHVVLGVFIAAWNLTLFNLLLSSASYQYASVSVATFHTVNSLTGIIGPFLGTMALQFVPIQTAFVLSTVIRSLGLLIFAWGLRSTLKTLFASSVQRVQKNLKRAFP